MSTSCSSDPTCSLGSSGCRHRWLLHTPHKPCRQSNTKSRPLPDSDTPCCTAPSGSRASQELSSTSPLCPLLSPPTQVEVLCLKDQTMWSHFSLLLCIGLRNIFTPCWNVSSFGLFIENCRAMEASYAGFVSLILTEQAFCAIANNLD